jgi:hypothetical protein
VEVTNRSESEARRVSKRELLKRGQWYPARIEDASDGVSPKGNSYISLGVVVNGGDGDERTLRDFLNNTPLGAAKLRHACEAVGALAQYEAGEVLPDTFAGREVSVKIGVEKRRGFRDRNIIEDYRAASAEVVTLRSAG